MFAIALSICVYGGAIIVLYIAFVAYLSFTQDGRERNWENALAKEAKERTEKADERRDRKEHAEGYLSSGSSCTVATRGQMKYLKLSLMPISLMAISTSAVAGVGSDCFGSSPNPQAVALRATIVQSSSIPTERATPGVQRRDTSGMPEHFSQVWVSPATPYFMC